MDALRSPIAGARHAGWRNRVHYIVIGSCGTSVLRKALGRDWVARRNVDTVMVSDTTNTLDPRPLLEEN